MLQFLANMKIDLDTTYVRLACDFLPTASGRVLVHNHQNGRILEVGAEVGRFLESYQRPRALREQIEFFTRFVAGGKIDAAQLTASLKALTDTGLLTNSDVFLKSTIAQSDKAPPKKQTLRNISIPSANRPESLARCVSSYQRNFKKFGRSVHFFVADNSASLEIQEQNQRALEKIKQDDGISISYCGPKERAAYIEELTRVTSIPREVLDFALTESDTPWRTAATNRNMIFLRNAGEVFFSADDDTLGDEVLGSGQEAPASMALGSAFEPSIFRVFESQDEAESAIRVLPFDLFSLHEEYLGQDASSLVAEEAPEGGIDLSDLGSQLATALMARPHRIRLTWTGTLGDSGMTAPFSYLMAGFSGFKEMVSSEEKFERLFKSRTVMRCAHTPTLTNSIFSQTIGLAFDTTTLVPPFCPGPWGSEFLFGEALRYSDPQSLTCFLPQMIRHLPMMNREYQAEAIWKLAERSTFPSLMGTLLSQLPPNLSSSPRENIKLMGHYLMSIGSQDLRRFCDVMKRLNGFQVGNYLVAMESQLAFRDSKPSFWARTVRKYIETVKAGLELESSWISGDILKVQPDLQKASSLYQKTVFSIGQMLWHWPDIVDGALELKGRGVRPGREL